ncbi:MAG: hypothetical protein PHU91_01480 [Candidatus Omnitrophica bacterium]|nr:hypothetical protein [Candidatus Omnitrophota bacterium]
MGLYLFDLFKKGLISPEQKIVLERRFVNPLGEMKSFEEWINSEGVGANNLIRAILIGRYAPDVDMERSHLKEAKEVLDKFYFVGITEQYNTDAAFLYNKIGIRRFCKNHNVAKRYYFSRNKRKMLDLAISKTALDREIYDYAIKLNREFKSKENFYPSVRQIRLRRLFSDLTCRTIRD